MPSASSTQTETKGRARKAPAKKQSMDLEDVMLLEMKEIYSAEKQLSTALPKLSRVIENTSIRDAFAERQERAETLLRDLDRCFDVLETSPGRKKNIVAEALIADAQEHAQEIEAGAALDAVLVGAMQKTEHYCIAAWGTVRALAESLGDDEIADVMQRVLDEGEAYDQRLTECTMEELMPDLESAMDGEEAGEAGERESAEAGRRSGGGKPRNGGKRE
jgi:ferritin-like metal-binding protein YciE